MAELGLFLLIAGPIVGGIVLLVGIIQLFGSSETAAKGRRTALIGLLIVVVSILIGFSICSMGASAGGFH
ncbi:hypothetical protein [Niabella beijingensis]|uniref:hypothetical protein n=1 Tax=Niabella beijingensis TaxID=2872700 RepID=UPI001CBBE503|nr:hypothetical protein [Niabella beijingensis]MBZ4190164.1 hypothetical protein [Niabella beijingensis]